MFVYNIVESGAKKVLFGKKISENACCARCRYRGGEEDGRYMCVKKGKVSPSHVCGKYVFDPFAPRAGKVREIDTSMLDPLDFEL